MSFVSVGCELSYDVIRPTTFLIHVAPARTPYQSVVAESLEITPESPHEERGLGPEGNRVFRLSAGPGELHIRYQAKVGLRPNVETPPEGAGGPLIDLPFPVLSYLNPSRYCESDRLIRLADQEFGHLMPGYSRVTAVCNWTYAHLAYQMGSTTAHTTACDVLVQRVGVCRDYAHLAIALCRALCIPARYISGYSTALEPRDFHGFFEAYLNGRWYLFDATRMAPLERFVRIASGRDAADASFATILGFAQMKKMVVLAEDRTPGSPPRPGPASDSAISTA